MKEYRLLRKKNPEYTFYFIQEQVRVFFIFHCWTFVAGTVTSSEENAKTILRHLRKYGKYTAIEVVED